MITSASNPALKRLKKMTVPKYRKRENAFLVDDYKIIEEALKCHYLPDEVYVSKDFPNLSHLNVIRVKETLLSSISDLSSFSGIIAVFPMPFVDFSIVSQQDSIILLDGVQDPVNVGTILRSSVLFGIKAAVLLPPTADPFSLKAIRAGKGAVFHLPVFKIAKEQLDLLLKNKNLYLADASNGNNLYDIVFEKPFVVAMGGEGHGLSNELKSKKGQVVNIPNTEMLDSLNVGSAASIILSFIYNKLGLV
jgi:TrmH family RNA methyltransferase